MDVPATRVRSGPKNIAAPPKRTESTQIRPARRVIAEMKARQSAKIRELGQVMIDVGLRSLEDAGQRAWTSAQHRMDHSQNVSQKHGTLSGDH